MSNSLLKKIVAGVSATAITLSIVAPVTSVSAAANAEIEAANKLAAAKVIKDNSANVADYKLGDNITRREMAKVMINLAEIEVTDSCEGKFADLPAGDWGCKYAEAALAKGFVAANATFGADNNISKWESLKFILKAKGMEKAEGVEPFQAAYVKAAMDAKVISESFTDYNTSAKRGWIFMAGANSLEAKDEEPTNDLCELFGTCDDEKPTDEKPVDEKPTDEKPTDETPTTPSDVEGKLLEVSLSPESPRNGERIPVDTPRVTMMKLEVSAGDEDVEMKKITLDATGFGAPEFIDDIVLYDAKGDKVSRQRNMSKSNQNVELDFINDFTVKAGTTQTLTVSVMIDGQTNDATGAKNGDVFGLKVSELDASATVKGTPVESAKLEAVELSSQGKLKIQDDKATQDIKIGEESKLAGFKMKVEDDEEDMTLKTIRLKQTGSADEDNFSDLYLNVDGKKLIDNLTFKGEYVTVNFGEGFVFDKDKTSYVYFELRGSVSGDPADTVKFEIEESDDIYAVGNKNGYNVPVDSLTDNFAISDALTVEGSEISVDFVKSDKDGVNKDTDDFDFGTLKIKANSGNYNLKEYEIMLTVKRSGSNITQNDLLEDIRLGGVSAEKDLTLDNSSNIRAIGANDNNTQRYLVEFKDITLTKGEAKELKLTADIPKDVAYGVTYEFDLSFVDNDFNIEDEDTDTEYTEIDGAGSNKAKDILSSYSGFDSRKIEVEAPTLKVDNTNIDNEDVVLGDVTIKAYKGTIEAGSAADVRLRQLVFENVGANPVGDLDDVIQSATLRIGSVEEKSTDIAAGKITFNNLDQTIKAGASNKQNIEVLVQFKDANATAIAGGNDEVALSLDAYDAEDKDTGNELSATGITDDKSNLITLATSGKLTIEIDTSDDSSSERKDLTHKDRFLLGGAESQILARIEMDSDKEAVKVKDLTVKSATFNDGDATKFKNSFENVRLVKEDKTTSVGNVGNFEVVDPVGANNEYVKAYLEDMDLIVNTDKKQVYFLMADVKKIDLGTDAVDSSATAGANTTFSIDDTSGTYRVDGENSGDELTDTNTPASDTLVIDNAVSTKKVTVVASDVATISIAKISSTPAVGDFVDVARITIDDKNSVNVDADDNSINPALKKLAFDSSDISVSGVTSAATQKYTLQLRETDNSSEKMTLAAGAYEFDNINTYLLNKAAEVEGKTEFILSLKVNDGGSTSVDADSKVTIRLDRENMEFVDGSADVNSQALAATATILVGGSAETTDVASQNITLNGNTIAVDLPNNATPAQAATTVANAINGDAAYTASVDVNNNLLVNITSVATAAAANGAIDVATNLEANTPNTTYTKVDLAGGRDAGTNDAIGGQVFNKVYDTGAEVNAD